MKYSPLSTSSNNRSGSSPTVFFTKSFNIGATHYAVAYEASTLIVEAAIVDAYFYILGKGSTVDDLIEFLSDYDTVSLP